MKRNPAILILWFAPMLFAGCYTTLKQSGNYYSEFDRDNYAQRNAVEPADDSTDSRTQDSEEVTVYNNYYSAPPAYYPYPARNYFYGYDYTYGWGFSVGYPYYDPFYDPYHNYYGWCYYPSYPPAYCPDPTGTETTTGYQRTYGSRRIFTTNTNPFAANSPVTARVADAGIPMRRYKTVSAAKSTSNSQPIQEERVRRNYRRIFGISEDAKKESASEKKSETKKDNSKAHNTDSGRSAAASDRSRSASTNDRSSNSGKAQSRSQEGSRGGRKYRN